MKPCDRSHPPELRERTARFREIDLNRSPFTVAWEITRACAFACIHCRAEAQPKRDPGELDTEEAMGVIDQIRQTGDPILVVTGGDPLTRPDVYDLLAYAVSTGLRTSLTPTATALANRRNLARIKEAGVRRLAISLDGANAEVHDRFRGFAGSFARTMRIVEEVREADLSLQINTTVSRHNVDTMDAIAEIVAGAHAVQWSLFFLVPTGRAKMEDMISADDHERLFNWLLELSQTAPFDVKATAAPAYRRVAIQRAKAQEGPPHPVSGPGFQFQDGLDRPTIGINDGKGFAFVSHTGDVCPSGFLPLPAGNVRESSFAEIYRSSQLFTDLRDPGLLKGKCGVCKFNIVCGGSRARAFAVHRDYLESDPSCVYRPNAVGSDLR